MGFIDSERSVCGEPLRFVVTRDVVAGDHILIRRGTSVAAVVVKARRAKWGWFLPHHAKLTFVFNQTIASDGQVIRLRGSPARSRDPEVVVDRMRLHHDAYQWVSDADFLNAYVEGDYEF